ncbi:uncharacterized protein TNCV_4556891 [Trichonephila clavipes]|nr:uncharacterized protein TNCV_4556891 [Trichonephila clavipes]
MDNQDLVYEKYPKYLGYILDLEWTSNKHMDRIVSKRRQQLKFFKYIAGKDWEADAVTLRNTYMALIRSILEYDFPAFSCASDTNLDKLEKNPTQRC